MASYSLIIDGKKVATEHYFDVMNPASGEVVGACPQASDEQLDDAVTAANRAFKSWSAVPDAERQAAVNKMAEVLVQNSAELAELLTREQGKPLKGLGSEFELEGCVGWTQATAALSLPVKIIEETEESTIEQHRKPIGVVGSIAPWNWPLMIGIWHIIPAIRSGCTVVMKPSSLTPLSSIRMVELFNEVLPAGVLNIVTGGGSIGRRMATHEGIQKIVFTGSTPTGKNIMENASATLKRLTLELGGNDAGIVLPDANVPAIIEKLFWGSFINSGQTCAALKRLYVHEDIHDQVCEGLAAMATQMPMGDGLDENNIFGPVQNQAQFDYVRELVDDAKAQGGRVLCGGEPGEGLFYPLTLIADVTDGCRIVDEEQFGPVLPIIKYTDIDDAIRRANDCENGLGGSIWTSDLEKGKQLSMRLECGTAWVNKHAIVQPNVPFGGVKASGFGVEFAEEGLAEYTSIQIVSIDKN